MKEKDWILVGFFALWKFLFFFFLKSKTDIVENETAFDSVGLKEIVQFENEKYFTWKSVW